MKPLTLTALAPRPDAAEAAATTQVALRQAAWVGVVCQFWVGVLCLAGSILLAESGGMTVLCGVVASISCFAPLVYAIVRRQWVVLFSCLTIFNLAPIWFLYLEIILPGHDAYLYSRPMYKMEAVFWAAAFQFFSNLIYLLFWHRVTVPSIRIFSFLKAVNLSARFYSITAILTFTVPLVAFWVYYGSGEILWVALTAGRAEGGSGGGLLVQDTIGSVSSYMLPLNWVWQLTPLLGTIAFVSTEHKGQPLPLVAFSAGLLVVFEFFLGGSRSIMMSVVAPVLFFYFYYNWDKGLRFWITAGSLLFVLIGVMELQVRFRSNLLEVLADPDKAAHSRGLASATTFDPTQSHRDNNMYLFCLMVQGYPDRYPYEGFNNFFATLANPVPRAIWPGKPVLNGANDISHQAQFVLDGPLLMGTTSLTYSVVGEAYQAGGMWAMLVYGAVYGVFMLVFDGLVYYASQRQALSVGVLGVSVFLSFWGYRSFFGLVTFIYPLLLLLLVLYACKALKLV